MKPLYQKLTVIEFNSAIRHLKKQNSRLSENSIDLARLVLVDGNSASALARQYQLTAQLVNRIAAKIHQAFMDSRELPPGWESIRVDLPADEAKKVLALETALKSTLRKSDI